MIAKSIHKTLKRNSSKPLKEPLLRFAFNTVTSLSKTFILSDNPPIGKGSISKGDENSDTSQSKVLRDTKIFKNLVPNKVSG